ncbi:MAG: hypothetical protein VKJ06_07875 [Vampirovibrionales bacterium]|nr:hypothetical protein [Vampirovibrionales bacterium]
MKLFITIPCFWKLPETPEADETLTAEQLEQLIDERRQQLSINIARLHQLFGQEHWSLSLLDGSANPEIERNLWHLEITVVTTPDNPVTQQLYIPSSMYTLHTEPEKPAEQLGYVCHGLMAQAMEQAQVSYDMFAYLEEDLLITDPLFFNKLRWFTETARDKGVSQAVLIPNRVELSVSGPVNKLYIDGQTGMSIADYYQDLASPADLTLNPLGMAMKFERAQNPYSGCFALTRTQMRHWMSQPWFNDGDLMYRGAKESGAVLSLMKTFPMYRPGIPTPSFLEIQHTNTRFIEELERSIAHSLEQQAMMLNQMQVSVEACSPPA